MRPVLRATVNGLVAGVNRLDKSFSPWDTVNKFRAYKFTIKDSIYILHILSAFFWLALMQVPPFPYKLAIPILYAIALLIPFTSQFFIPATPVFSWVLMFYSNQFLPADHRPAVHVVLLPTLESVLYGANISDILTHLHTQSSISSLGSHTALSTTHSPSSSLLSSGSSAHPLSPYSQKPLAIKTAALTTCSVEMATNALLLARPSYLVHSPVCMPHGPLSKHYSSPPCGPSMRNGLGHYAAVLYWSTMYLSHHYLIDVVGGACLATACFYFFVPEELRNGSVNVAGDKYERYDLESRRGGVGADEFASDWTLSDEEETPIAYRSPNPAKGKGRGHRHTASIASLIRPDERAGEEGWSPVAGVGFVFPPESRR
ncbi:PAP2-domain-containing protein [Suillus variegatus]|nr:PAP2-domain-containing protein [Suillus variegatus]